MSEIPAWSKKLEPIFDGFSYLVSAIFKIVADLEKNDIFFGIVRRGRAMIILKDIGVEPPPNHKGGIGKGDAGWDAYLYVPDPVALPTEFESRGFGCYEKVRVGSNSSMLTVRSFFRVSPPMITAENLSHSYEIYAYNFSHRGLY